MPQSLEKIPSVQRRIFVHALLSACVALLLVLSTGDSAAESLSAEEIKITTPVYHPDFSEFEPALGLYEYHVNWQGIGAARAWVNVDRVGDEFHVTTVAKTTSFIDIFYKLRYTASGVLSATDLAPVRTLIDHKENSREKKTDMQFLPDGEIHAVRWKKGQGTEVLQFDTGNFTLDPFSAAFLARSLDWEVGQTRDFDTFNGKTRYLIKLNCSDKVNMKINGQDTPVWIISPHVENLNDPKKDNKLREAKIYVSADRRREILSIVSSVFIGSVNTQLDSFTPSGKFTPTQVAQLEQVGLLVK